MLQVKQVKQVKQMKQTASRARFKKPTVKAGALWRWVGIQPHPGDDEGSGRPDSLEGMESLHCVSKRARKTRDRSIIIALPYRFANVYNYET